MTLGFHYHVPVILREDDKYYTSGAIGVFIDSLARECSKVICFMHYALASEIKQMDYCFQENNIEVIEIGPHDLFLKRMLRGYRIKKTIQPYLGKIDLMLIRGPSPLLPLISSICQKQNISFAYLLVGDYVKSFDGANVQGIKRFILKNYYTYNKKMQNQYAKKALVFVNSRVLYEEYQTISLNTIEIKTTTLTEKDFFKKEHSDFHNPVELLYTGRIEPAKGLEEVLEAMILLRKQGIVTKLNLVGWEDKKGYIEYLFQKAQKNNLEENIVFHGKKQIGEELFSMYRNADIYIIASKGNEGFPRTIWEAMANSVPVIASRIGSIPHFLNENENILLVESENISDIVLQITKLVSNQKLVNELIKNAYEKAKDNTLEKQAKKMISMIKKYIVELNK